MRPSLTTFASRQFSDEDQAWFVRVSGDANPIHADRVLAADMFPGAIIVHGMHALTWLLEEYFKREKNSHVRNIRATFLKPILLNETVVAGFAQTEGGVKMALAVRGTDVTTVDIGLGETTNLDVGPVIFSAKASSQPVLRALADLEGVAGELALPPAADDLVRQFPTVAGRLGKSRLLGLSSLATLVGMECPGLYGVSTEIAVHLSDHAGALAYRVEKVDKRFGRVRVAVAGYGLSGTVAAFVNEPKRAVAAK